MSIDTRALIERTDIVAVASAYTKLKKSGIEFCGPCPVHGGDGDNFYVNPQKRIWACFSRSCHECDEGNDVIGLVRRVEGLDFKAACERLGATSEWKPTTASVEHKAKPRPERITSKPPPDAGRPNMHMAGALGDPSRVWEYKDADGQPLFFVARYDTSDDDKEIRCWTWGHKGTEPPAWGCGHPSKPRPMYGLDRLAARPGAPVMLVEGEKAADAAQDLLGQYVVLTWPGGSNAWKHVDFEPLRGKRVDLWPDNDEPGTKAMQGIAVVIASPRGLACYGKVIDPRGMPDGGDAADWPGGDIVGWLKERATWYAEQNPEPQPTPPDAPPALAPLPESEEAAGSGPDEPIPLDAYRDEPAAQKKPKNRKRHLHVVGNTALDPQEDAEPMPAALGEDALKDHFVETYGDDWRYCTEWAQWLQWEGDGWHRDKRNEVSHLCMLVTREALSWQEAATLTPDGRRKINSKRTAWNVRDVAAVDRRISIDAEVLDRYPMMLGVPGGVVDLKTGRIHPAAREQYITRRCTVAPQAGPHPLFDRVLARACAEHDGMREYLLRWFGYMLTGQVNEEAFMFLHGPGGSGKSTLIKCLTEIMGDYAMTISMDALTETAQQRHSQEIAKLEGARLVYASETEEGRRWKESLIKWLTGGDKIVAHRMRMDDREFQPTFKLLIYGNSVPHLKSVGEEMRRRIHLVEYAGSLSESERDTTLKQRLTAEYPAILATLIRGCVDWQQAGGLGKPESVSASVEQYLESEDSFAAFLEECADRDANARELSSEVYKRYRAWATNVGEYVMSQKRFVQALKTRGFDTHKSNGARMLTGLKLRRVSSMPDDAPGWTVD